MSKVQAPRHSPGRQWRWSKAIPLLLVVAAFVSTALAVRGWFRAGVSLDQAPLALDGPLYRHLLRATVCISSQDGTFRGCGVLVDQADRLVVTVAEVVGDRENASAYLVSGDRWEIQNLVDPSLAFKIAAKVVHRDPSRRLVLLHLERWPEGAATLPLGAWTGSPGKVLHSVYQEGQNHSTLPEHTWSCGLARVRQSLMLPHW